MGAGPLARTVNKEMPKKEVAWRRKSNKSAPKRPGVPSELLVPRDRWGDKADYDATAAKLVGLFRANFSKFTDGISAGIARHGL